MNTSRSSDKININKTNDNDDNNNNNNNNSSDRVNSLTQRSLGLSLYSHNRSTPRREGLLEAALRRREENRLGHHNTQTPLSSHLQHNKVYSAMEHSASNAFAQKRATNSPAINIPVTSFVKDITTNSSATAIA